LKLVNSETDEPIENEISNSSYSDGKAISNSMLHVDRDTEVLG